LLAAHVQLCAAIPNFLVLEYRPDPKDDLVTSPLRAENGYITVPDTPGIGVEFNEEAVAKYPFIPKYISTATRADGSVGYG
jgi:mannonate dehydratase